MAIWGNFIFNGIDSKQDQKVQFLLALFNEKSSDRSDEWNDWSFVIGVCFGVEVGDMGFDGVDGKK